MKEVLFTVCYSEKLLSLFECLLSSLMLFDFFMGSDDSFNVIEELDFSNAK